MNPVRVFIGLPAAAVGFSLHRVAVEWGRIAAIRPRGDADGLIAATAVVHEMVLVTRNVADFDHAGVAVVNPWD